MRLTPPTAGASGLSISAAIAGAQCGIPYDATVQLSANQRITAVRVDPALGLSVDPRRPGRLHGVPEMVGTHHIDVSVCDARGTVRSIAVLLHISPNPRSMWKDLPSDAKAPFQKAPLDQQCWTGATGVQLIGVSCRGRMHANVGGFREDDFSLGCLPGDQLAVIAADGAGSSPLSREGSRLAVSAALSSMRADLTADSSIDPVLLLGNAARASLRAIGQQAARSQRPVSDFHSTLLIAVTSAAPPHRVVVLQVGDGLIAALSPNGQWSAPLGVADHGDFHGQTHFLSELSIDESSLVARIQQHHFAQLRYLLVSTDGMVDPWFETDLALTEPGHWQPYVARLDRALQAPAGAVAGLHEWLQDFTPGHHDDRTLALAVWPSSL